MRPRRVMLSQRNGAARTRRSPRGRVGLSPSRRSGKNANDARRGTDEGERGRRQARSRRARDRRRSRRRGRPRSRRRSGGRRAPELERAAQCVGGGQGEGLEEPVRRVGASPSEGLYDRVCERVAAFHAHSNRSWAACGKRRQKVSVFNAGSNLRHRLFSSVVGLSQHSNVGARILSGPFGHDCGLDRAGDHGGLLRRRRERSAAHLRLFRHRLHDVGAGEGPVPRGIARFRRVADDFARPPRQNEPARRSHVLRPSVRSDDHVLRRRRHHRLPEGTRDQEQED